MEQVKHGYTSPKAKVVIVEEQCVLCGSPYGENNEKFTIGDKRYDESDWD